MTELERAIEEAQRHYWETGDRAAYQAEVDKALKGYKARTPNWEADRKLLLGV